MMAKTAFVTGANGFIGSALTRRLCAAGWNVKAFVLEGTAVDSIAATGATIISGDITRPDTIVAAIKGADCVFHLAAIASDWGPFALHDRVNHIGTRNVLEAAAGAGVKRFVHTSSLAVHRYRPYFGADETAPRDAVRYAYALTKRLAEDAVTAAGAAGRIETVIIRPAIMPYGPGDPINFRKVIEAVEKGFFGYIGGGRQRMSVVYVDDLCDGMILAAESPRARGEVFNIADETPRTWREVAETIAHELGVKPPWVSIPYPLAKTIAEIMEACARLLRSQLAPPLTAYRIDVAHCDLFFTSAKAKAILGFSTKVELAQGIKRSIAWYRELNG